LLSPSLPVDSGRFVEDVAHPRGQFVDGEWLADSTPGSATPLWTTALRA
jgi:hypothetical protein